MYKGILQYLVYNYTKKLYIYIYAALEFNVLIIHDYSEQTLYLICPIIPSLIVCTYLPLYHNFTVTRL